jgi:glutathione S-transferase
MIQIYGQVKSSAGRCFWLLEELGLPYEQKNVDFSLKEHKSDWFLKINPNGKVPAMVDGNFTLFESMAINYYLTEKYKPSFMGNTIEEKAMTHQWSFWAISELQAPFVEILIQKVFIPEERRNYKIIEDNEKMLTDLVAVFDNSLNNKKFINGNEFTLADLNVASVVSIAHAINFSLEKYHNINKWFSAISERPSFQKYMNLRF